MNADEPQGDTRPNETSAWQSLVALEQSTAPKIATAQAPSERFQSAADLEAWLVSAAIAQYGHLFGQPASCGMWNWGRPVYLDGAVMFRNAEMLTATTALANGFSDTNVQVEGVDEADLVETDGEYLYVISGHNLVIVKAGVGDNLRVVSQMHLGDRPTGMFLSGNRLALVSSNGSIGWPGDIGAPWLGASDGYYQQSSSPTTTLTLIDIGDRTAPSIVQRTELDGELVASRVVDGQLRLVLGNRFNLPVPILEPVEGELNSAADPSGWRLGGSQFETLAIRAINVSPSEDSASQVYETKEGYFARVREQLLDLVIPRFRSLASNGSVAAELRLAEPQDIYRPQSLIDRTLTTIAAFDLTSDEAGPTATVSVISGNAAQVYSTADDVYLFAQNSFDTYRGINASAPATSVWKFAFDVDTHAIELAARGSISGTLLNQFAADEHDGFLRVVTKSNDWGSKGQSLQVLKVIGHRLKVVGRIDGIAEGERLHAVRFMGDRAFLVTFRQVDPLFAVDLSDPTAPKLVGELVIPGVSGYLQPIDEHHLLGVGRAMDPSGFMFSNLEVSLFDISDLADPQLLHRYAFDGGWSTNTPVLQNWWIPFTGDHHAASYFAEEHIFAMPVFSTEGGNLDGVASTPFFEPGKGGLQVFRIDAGTGFTPLAFIEHGTLVERSLRIDDHLFAISGGGVSAHELEDPGVKLGEIEIVAESDAHANEPVDAVIWRPGFELPIVRPIDIVIGAPIELPRDEINSVSPMEDVRALIPLVEIGEIDPCFGAPSIIAAFGAIKMRASSGGRLESDLGGPIVGSMDSISKRLHEASTQSEAGMSEKSILKQDHDALIECDLYPSDRTEHLTREARILSATKSSEWRDNQDLSASGGTSAWEQTIDTYMEQFGDSSRQRSKRRSISRHEIAMWPQVDTSE